MSIVKVNQFVCLLLSLLVLRMGLLESMMGLRPRQGNLRLVFRLFSLMRGLPEHKT